MMKSVDNFRINQAPFFRLKVKIPPRQMIIKTDRATCILASRFGGVYLFIGHGSKGQIADIASVQDILRTEVVANLDKRHGSKNWLAVFGGDSYDPEKPDIAAATKFLRTECGVPLLAIQSDAVKAWAPEKRENEILDQHINFVRFTDSTRNKEGKIVWGGIYNDQLAGPTRLYLGDDFKEILKGVICLGGGPIGLEEAKIAKSNGIPIFYVRTVAKNANVNGLYGSLDEWAMSLHLDVNPFATEQS